MTQWYHADRQRRQVGPQTAADIAARFRTGEIDAATLVWREGLDTWKPLGSLRVELGLEEAAATLDFRVDPLPAAASPGQAAAPTDALGMPPPAPAGGQPPVAAYAHPAAADDVVQAGLWRRFAASCIDGVVTGIASYVVLIPLMLVFGVGLTGLAEAMDVAGSGFNGGFMAAYYAVSLSVPALYFAWMHSSRTQASLGKMAVGIRVVRGDGSALGFGRALLRYLAYLAFIVLTCGLGMLVSGLMVAFTRRKQAPHDMVCDTLVVDRWAFSGHPEWQKRGLDTVTIVVLVLFGLFLLAVAAAVVVIAATVSSMAF